MRVNLHQIKGQQIPSKRGILGAKRVGEAAHRWALTGWFQGISQQNYSCPESQHGFNEPVWRGRGWIYVVPHNFLWRLLLLGILLECSGLSFNAKVLEIYPPTRFLFWLAQIKADILILTTWCTLGGAGEEGAKCFLEQVRKKPSRLPSLQYMHVGCMLRMKHITNKPGGGGVVPHLPHHGMFVGRSLS